MICARAITYNLLPLQKTIDSLFFGGGKHNGNWLVLLSKDYVMDLAHIMNKNQEYRVLNFSKFEAKLFLFFGAEFIY